MKAEMGLKRVKSSTNAEEDDKFADFAKLATQTTAGGSQGDPIILVEQIDLAQENSQTNPSNSINLRNLNQIMDADDLADFVDVDYRIIHEAEVVIKPAKKTRQYNKRAVKSGSEKIPEKAETPPIATGNFVLEENANLLKPNKPDQLVIMHWNVNSLNTKLDRDAFIHYIQSGNFDVLCFNETKYSDKRFATLKIHENPLFKGKFHQYWHFSTRKPGYSGVCVLSKLKALSVRFGIDDPLFDTEGRAITVEFEEFYLISVYVPCSGMDRSRLTERINNWEAPIWALMKQLRAKKHVMLVGDLNVAHTEQDVYSPQRAWGFPGFYPEERQCFNNLMDDGYRDTFRELYPGETAYTWWDTRTGGRYRNEGFRLDYCLVDKEAMSRVDEVKVRTDIYGSDHCPLEITFRYNENQKNSATKKIEIGKEVAAEFGMIV